MGSFAPTRQVYGSWLDPRPDLESDAAIWAAVLAEAQRSDPYPNSQKSIFGLLHGLRCGGAQLVIREAGSIRLDYSALVLQGMWTNNELRGKWLMPAAATIKRIFNKVEHYLHSDPNQISFYQTAAGL